MNESAARSAPLERRPAAPGKKPTGRMVRSLTVAGSGANRPTPSRWIPAPEIPVKPVLSATAFLGARAAPLPCVLDQGHGVLVTSGRVAIARALELMGLASGDEVLMPAYHCSSMVDALSWVQAKPVFYRIKPDLSADLADIAAKVGPKSRCLIAAHYFGFPQDLPGLRAFCDERALFLLEDCAHSLFGHRAGVPLGSLGDYAITSLPKFLPVREGGTLVTRDPRALALDLVAQGGLANLREAFSVLQEAIDHRRLSGLRPLVRALELARSLARSAGPAADGDRDPGPAEVDFGDRVDKAKIGVKASLVTSLIERLTPRRRLVERRIENYGRLAAAFASLSGCRPLFRSLPEGVVPFMVPLWVERLSEVFPKLEDQAVPMQRFGQFLWPGVDESVCEASAAFSHHLLQLPCHQELSAAELDWIIDRVAERLSS